MQMPIMIAQHSTANLYISKFKVKTTERHSEKRNYSKLRNVLCCKKENGHDYCWSILFFAFGFCVCVRMSVCTVHGMQNHQYKTTTRKKKNAKYTYVA